MACTCTLRGGRSGLLLGLFLGLSASLSWAQVPKEPATSLDQREFFRPELYISTAHVPLDDVLSQLPNRDAWQAFRSLEKGAATPVFVDPRSGAVTNIIRSVPLIPGNGVGNRLTLEDLGKRLGRGVEAVDAQVVADAFERHLAAQRGLLGIELGQAGAIKATQVNPDLWQIHIPQVVNGVPVRDARLAASISHGNLVTLGTETWGNVSLDTIAKVSAEKAIEAGFDYAGGRWPQDEFVRQARLEIVPVAPPQYQQGEAFGGPVGKGYQHRLVWTYVFGRGEEGAAWEVMVDAQSGEVLAFQDSNHYVSKQVKGGIYPLTSTEQCPDAARCGTMQAGYPMPWANTGLASPNNFTNSAGLFDYTSGTVTTTLSGRYVRVSDNCGAISESSSLGDLNLGGSNGQHDCTSAGSSAGDTPASRSAFYEVNKIAEVARGWLPSNTWLQNQLTANVNINQTCNGFWNGSTINFYRSGGGCRNTGEIAAVFDHEWGHGMDDNDANGSISVSGEAYADIASIYRLQASCVGYGFFWTSDRGCGQTADGTGYNQNEALQGAAHCNTNCSGVRDTDWAKHTDNTPDTALGFVCTSCTTGTGACGRQTHCSAAPVRQMAWDFVTRDLTAAPFSYDSQTAFTVGNKLFYHGTGNVGTWHACTCGSSASGCGTTNGYMQWITADDDNGNLNDGTPHMTAIYAAYNRHGIACATPTATNSGCAGGPSAAPTVTATPGSNQVALSWTTVSGATRYWVMRGEGHGGCNMAKVLVAEVTGTSYTDTQVANDRTYYYTVVAAGASSACYGRAASCVSVTPTGTTTPDFSLSCSPSSLSVQQGSSGTSTCTVTSTGGFNSAVSLACASLPSGVGCSYNPASVTPPA
ncbi:MAG TPA: endopeptidase, partial [Vicinamibacteria bacterium]|nr:endopeptidase [Vicinamibacteria bacterium]